MKSFKALAALTLLGVVVSARQNPAVRRMDVEARHRDIALDKRAPVPNPLDIGNLSDPGNNNSSVSQSASSTPNNNNNNTSTRDVITTTTTSTTPVQQPPTTTSTTPDQVTQPTTTSTSTTPTTSAARSTSTSAPTVVAQTRSTVDNYSGTILTANQGNISNLRASQTSTDTAADAASTSSGGSFMDNKSAVAATFTILGIVALGGIFFVGFWFYKKAQRGKLGEEDTWDEASMKEFSGPPPGTSISAPAAAVLSDPYGIPGLGRKNTVLPSQSAGAGGLNRSRSNHSPPRREIETDEEPDEILALPPVTHYERPRDSAYDIVPAAPPMAGYASHSNAGGYGQPGFTGYGNAYASSSGAAPVLQPPKRGDHSSFGSGLGNDPFAGSGFIDATRESTYGPGQAGRGAGYKAASSSGHGHDGQVGLGNQWPQGYNPYNGYAQGSQAPYGNGYGYAQ